MVTLLTVQASLISSACAPTFNIPDGCPNVTLSSLPPGPLHFIEYDLVAIEFVVFTVGFNTFTT